MGTKAQETTWRWLAGAVWVEPYSSHSLALHHIPADENDSVHKRVSFLKPMSMIIMFSKNYGALIPNLFRCIPHAPIFEIYNCLEGLFLEPSFCWSKT